MLENVNHERGRDSGASPLSPRTVRRSEKFEDEKQTKERRSMMLGAGPRDAQTPGPSKTNVGRTITHALRGVATTPSVRLLIPWFVTSHLPIKNLLQINMIQRTRRKAIIPFIHVVLLRVFGSGRGGERSGERAEEGDGTEREFGG